MSCQLIDVHISKVIFLDIDHVLTNTDVDNTSFLHFDPSKYRLSEVNLALLDNVLDATSAKIVIASNWRRFPPPPNDIWMLDGKGYKSPLASFKARYAEHIIGMLPPDRHITKCEALELWFEDNTWLSKSKGKYVIFEDDLREGYQMHPFYSKHLVLTDSRYGMTKADADKAINILNAGI